MNFTQVKGAEICEEWLVDQVVVNAEIEGMLARLGWVLITDPVKAPWDNFHRCVRVGVALTRSRFVVRLHHVFSKVAE